MTEEGVAKKNCENKEKKEKRRSSNSMTTGAQKKRKLSDGCDVRKFHSFSLSLSFFNTLL